MHISDVFVFLIGGCYCGFGLVILVVEVVVVVLGRVSNFYLYP